MANDLDSCNFLSIFDEMYGVFCVFQDTRVKLENFHVEIHKYTFLLENKHSHSFVEVPFCHLHNRFNIIYSKMCYNVKNMFSSR